MLHDPISHPDLARGAPSQRWDDLSFSVILPVYNRSHSIGVALTSLLAQIHPADEIIVLDDGSTDDLETTLAPYRAHIRLIRQANADVATARNAGAAAARGRWLTFQDSDDLWAPDHLATVVRDLTHAPGDTVAHLGDVTYTSDTYAEQLVDIKNRTFPQTHTTRVEDPLQLVISGMTLQGAAVWRDVFTRLEGFDAGMRMLSDTAFFCQLALEGPFAVAAIRGLQARCCGRPPGAILRHSKAGSSPRSPLSWVLPATAGLCPTAVWTAAKKERCARP